MQMSVVFSQETFKIREKRFHGVEFLVSFGFGMYSREFKYSKAIKAVDVLKSYTLVSKFGLPFKYNPARGFQWSE